MQCPFCHEPETRVVDSRLAEDGTQVRRRRECSGCKQRFTSFERAALSMPAIIKRDDSREPFVEDKLRRGMTTALYKRPVSPERVEHVVEVIMRRLRATGEREVASSQLGEWVMLELRDLDQVAFVRFASIYRRFEDIDQFREEIDQLAKLPSPELNRNQMPLITPDDSDDAAN